ncbi:hypothetical protein LINPERHAP1_LOCUS17148 [Linum perenne]
MHVKGTFRICLIDFAPLPVRKCCRTTQLRRRRPTWVGTHGSTTHQKSTISS